MGVHFCFCKGIFKAMKVTTLRVFANDCVQLKDLRVGDTFHTIIGRNFFGFVARQDPEKGKTIVYLEAYGSQFDYPDTVSVQVEPYQMRINTVRKK